MSIAFYLLHDDDASPYDVSVATKKIATIVERVTKQASYTTKTGSVGSAVRTPPELAQGPSLIQQSKHFLRNLRETVHTNTKRAPRRMIAYTAAASEPDEGVDTVDRHAHDGMTHTFAFRNDNKHIVLASAHTDAREWRALLRRPAIESMDVFLANLLYTMFSLVKLQKE